MIQRNAAVFQAWYTQSISRIKNLTAENVNPNPVRLTPSQSTQGFWECDELQRYCDEVEQAATLLKESAAKAPILPQPSSMCTIKWQEEVATVQLNQVLHGLRDQAMVVDASPAKAAVVEEIVQLGRDEQPVANDGAIPDELLVTDDIYSTAEIIEVLEQNKQSCKNKDLEVSSTQLFDGTDIDLLLAAGYIPEELDDTVRRVQLLAKVDGNDSSLVDAPPAEFKSTTDNGTTESMACNKRASELQTECQVTYKRRRSPTPDPATPTTIVGAVRSPVSDPLSAVGSRRRGRGDGLGCSYDCGPNTGLGLTVVSTFFRNNQDRFKDVPDLRRQVTDYFFLDDNGYPNV